MERIRVKEKFTFTPMELLKVTISIFINNKSTQFLQCTANVHITRVVSKRVGNRYLALYGNSM